MTSPTSSATPVVSTGLLAVVGAVVTRILLRNHATGLLIGQLIFFVALTALLLHHGIVPYQNGPVETSNVERVFPAVFGQGSSGRRWSSSSTKAAGRPR